MAKFSYSNVIVWKMLTHSKQRLALSLCGIAFATLVIFMEVGFFNGLNDSQANLATLINADIIMLSKRTRSINNCRKLSRARLYQAKGFEGVKEVVPLYLGQTSLKNPQTNMSKTIHYLAFPPSSAPFAIEGMDEAERILKKQGRVLWDSLSRDIYGKITPGMEVEAGAGKLMVGGSVVLGPNFGKNGNILTSVSTSNRYFGNRRLETISMGLIRTAPKTDIQQLKQHLLATLPDDIHLMTPEELRAWEVEYTIRKTPVGALLGIGLLVGFVIGIIISYQLLYNEVTDHLPQFATMKAVGFTNKTLISIIVKESLLLSILGFIPGLMAGFGLYYFIEHLTKIVMFLTLFRVLAVFFLTVFMCCIAGLIAVQKVLKADPAELF